MTVRRTVTVKRTIQVRQTRQVRSQVQSTAHSTRAIQTSTRALPRTAQPIVDRLVADGFAPLEETDREFDLFLSHASENKDFVRPLAEALDALGIRVWYDETCVSVGDSLRESIDVGLSRSRFGAVLFSHEFFGKRWPAYELNGLVAREMQGKKVILPLWHPDLTVEDMVGYSPSMADKLALQTAGLPIDEVAAGLAELVRVR